MAREFTTVVIGVVMTLFSFPFRLQKKKKDCSVSFAFFLFRVCHLALNLPFTHTSYDFPLNGLSTIFYNMLIYPALLNPDRGEILKTTLVLFLFTWPQRNRLWRLYATDASTFTFSLCGEFISGFTPCTENHANDFTSLGFYALFSNHRVLLFCFVLFFTSPNCWLTRCLDTSKGRGTRKKRFFLFFSSWIDSFSHRQRLEVDSETDWKQEVLCWFYAEVLLCGTHKGARIQRSLLIARVDYPGLPITVTFELIFFFLWVLLSLCLFRRHATEMKSTKAHATTTATTKSE